MIFASRRTRLLFIALAGMEAAVLTPFLLLLFLLLLLCYSYLPFPAMGAVGSVLAF